MEQKRTIVFKAVLNIKSHCYTFELNDCIVYLYFNEDEIIDVIKNRPVLLQESRSLDLGKGGKLEFHRSNNSNIHDPSKDHLHYFLRGKQIFAINRDGTAHDGFHGVVMPKNVYNYIKSNYPDFTLPQNRMLESLDWCITDVLDRVELCMFLE